MEKALELIAEKIKQYRNCSINDGETLNYLLQQLSATLAYLETERANIHDAFQREINELVLSGQTVARAENEAHKRYPEMYLLRRVMDSAYKVCDAIRTNISYLKTEKRNA